MGTSEFAAVSFGFCHVMNTVITENDMKDRMSLISKLQNRAHVPVPKSNDDSQDTIYIMYDSQDTIYIMYDSQYVRPECSKIVNKLSYFVVVYASWSFIVAL